MKQGEWKQTLEGQRVLIAGRTPCNITTEHTALLLANKFFNKEAHYWASVKAHMRNA